MHSLTKNIYMYSLDSNKINYNYDLINNIEGNEIDLHIIFL